MPSFDYIIGNGRKEVTIEYKVTHGDIDNILVLASFEEGPEDISEYLSTYEMNLIEYKCNSHMHESKICMREDAI